MTKNRILSTILIGVCCLFQSSANASPVTGLNPDLQMDYIAPLQNDPIEYCDSTAHCFQQSQCDDSSCQNEVVLCHQICEATFNTMASAYGTPYVYLGSYSVGNIKSMLNTISCTAGDYISYMETAGTISLSPSSGAFTTSSSGGRYSIAFLKGVIRQYKPGNSDVFRFYKIKDANGVESIGLKLTKDNVDVFFSDVSGMYP